jgi:CPA2 family monovalent cation:H+ antiporter-2
MEHSPLNDVLILLALAVLAVASLRRLHLPPILGYLFVGALAGPAAAGWIPSSEAIHLFAEVGVVFLLFMIGLEISIPHLVAMRGAVLGLGGAQVALTTALAALLAWAVDIPWQGALVIGGAVAMSSTAIAAKQLTEQLEMQSRHGRIALAVLLFQDLAVVPFLVLIPILADSGAPSLAGPMLWALVKGAAAFAIMFASGHWLLRPLFHWVAAAHSVELFTLAILLVSLTAAWITSEMGLSLALGAFLAGMMLGETEYRHQVETEIRPFRDVLMGLFFISVGTQLNLAVLPDTWPWVALMVLGLTLGKGLLVTALVRLGGHEPGVAMRAGVVLGQGGEFGFALLTLALAHHLLSPTQSQPLLAALVFSMVLAPVAIRHNGALAKTLCASTYLRGREVRVRELAAAAEHLAGHVIICGFGRIGQNLASFLREEGFGYVALDLDPLLIREAWEAGERVFYGDSTHAEILEVAGLQRARAVVVTFHDAHTAGRIVRTARRHHPSIPIVVRTQDDAHLEALEKAGASDVVPEAVEASMMLATHLLRRLGVADDEVLRLVDKTRQDHYRRLRGFFHGEEVEAAAEADRYRLHTVVLSAECAAVGRRIDELGLAGADLQINALRRGDIVGEAPDGALVLQEGDAVVLQGPPEQLAHAEQRLIGG